MISTLSMPSTAAAAKARASSALSSWTTNAPTRRPAASMLSAMPASSPPSRVSASSRLFPALSHRSRRLLGRTSSLVPLNSYDRDVYRRVPPPASPPPLTEPVPPPPPPPPPRKNNFLSGGGAWITAFFVGLALWYGFLVADVPQIQTGSHGFSYVTTKGGNRVLIAEDEAGRTFLVDQDANLYYDSGIEEVGWYIVGGKDGEVTNLFYDEQNDGQLTRRVVGNIKDLKQVNAQALAGIRLDEVDQDEFLRGTDDATEANTIVGFASGANRGAEDADKDDDDDLRLPPNAPLTVAKDGSLKGPPVLDEGVLTLKAKKEGAGFKPRKGDRLDELVAMFDAAVESGAVGVPVGNPLAEGFSVPGIPSEVNGAAGNAGAGK